MSTASLESEAMEKETSATTIADTEMTMTLEITNATFLRGPIDGLAVQIPEQATIVLFCRGRLMWFAPEPSTIKKGAHVYRRQCASKFEYAGIAKD